MATFAIPGQVYPTRIRATAHGLSSAAGKLGAAIGAQLFPLLRASVGVQGVLLMCAGLSLVASAWTLVFVPAYGWRELDQIAVATNTPGMTQYQLAKTACRILCSGSDTGATAQEAIPIAKNFRSRVQS